MKHFQDARSGVLVAIVLFGMGAFSFVCLVLLGVADVVNSLQVGVRIAISTKIAMVVGGGASLLFGMLSLSNVKTLQKWQRMVDRPIMAWAVLTGEPHPLNTKINRARLFQFPMTVTPPHRAPYGGAARWFFPRDLRTVARPGARVIVRIDPEDMNEVVIDWDQTRASWGMPPPRQ